jgi:predicted porin
MKKSLIALATLGAMAGVVHAQSSVTLYGVVDASVAREKGSTTQTLMKSGGLNGSRWGLRVVEDLGSGLKGMAVLESGFNLDTGISGQDGQLFGRQAYIGLGGGFGEVRLGRQYTPIGLVADDFVGTKPYDVLSVAGTLAAKAAYRTDNAITFMTPSMSGFSLQGQYSLGLIGNESASGVNKNFNKHFGLSAGYKGGPFAASVGYLQIIDNSALIAGSQRRRAALAGASYDFGMAKLAAYYSVQGMDLGARQKVYGGALDFPVGAFTLSVGGAMVKNSRGVDSGVAAFNDDARIFTVQGKYDLSKRTALYAGYTGISNKDFSRLTINSALPVNNGESSYGAQVGVRHRF